MKIFDGRTEFYQWDTDRQLIIEDITISEVHFYKKLNECALVCEVFERDGLRLVNVPNILLQRSGEIRAYANCSCYTRKEARFKVIARGKPEDYVYTETEIKRWEDIESRLDEIEEKGVSQEVIENAVNDYLEKNPIQTGATEEQAAQIERNKEDIAAIKAIDYATEDYVNKAIENAEIDIDLSNYYTKSETNTAINAAKPDLTPYATKTWVEGKGYLTQHQDLSNYAKKTDIPSLAGYATETYVNKAITDAQLAGGDVDLTGYATEDYVNEKIAAIPETDLSNYYTKTETNNAINNAKPDLEPYAKKTDIPSLSGYATEQYVNNAIDDINIPSLDGYATEKYVDDAIEGINIPDVSEFQTEAQVIALINANMPVSGDGVEY